MKGLGANYAIDHSQQMVEQVKALGFEHVDHIAMFNDIRHWQEAVELIRPLVDWFNPLRSSFNLDNLSQK